MADNAVSYEFKAEVKQLLDILVHSLYTKKEIFLRELISNASDALNKLRYESNRGSEIADEDLEEAIRIEIDKEAGTLTVSDSGVGMTREEIIDNIGSIAHSGTSELLKKATEEGGLEGVIGRFGVGFYSIYMVADTVTVRTKSFHKDAVAYEWVSDGKGGYTIAETGEDRQRGTQVTLRLKEDLADEYLSADRLKDIIRNHSNFVSYPVFVGEERVNTVSALWREPKSKVTTEQYKEFYTFLTYDQDEPFETMHISVDAPVQFSALLFIPRSDLNPLGFNMEDRGLDLYARRVLIQKDNKDLLPQYLGFVKGVVDVEDLPLNISRETLQDNRIVKTVENALTKQALSHLTKAAGSDPDRYAEFWKTHGKVFKLCYADFINKDRIAPLLRFNSSLSEDAESLASFDDYVARAKEGQKTIWYVTAPSRQAAELSPHSEVFRRKGLEVLYLYEPVDEFCMDAVRTYKEFEIKSVEHADMAELDAYEDKEAEDRPEPLTEEETGDFDKLLERFRQVLGERVAEVRSSKRLSNSAVCLVGADGGVTSGMERVMRLMSNETTAPRKILEINPDHPMIRSLMHANKNDPDDEFVAMAVEQLFESAMLLEGYLSDPHALVGRMQELLTKAGDMDVRQGEKEPPSDKVQ